MTIKLASHIYKVLKEDVKHKEEHLKSIIERNQDRECLTELEIFWENDAREELRDARCALAEFESTEYTEPFWRRRERG